MTVSKSAIRILIVDDEAIVRESLGNWLREEGYVVDVAGSGKETLQKLAESSYDIFLIDIKMPGMDGLQLQRRIREIAPRGLHHHHDGLRIGRNGCGGDEARRLRLHREAL